MSTSSQRLGKYELLERLGYGGMAEVWKALDTQLQRYVAIKLLHANLRDDPNFASRFQREAQLIAQLHHPNIVKVHDFQIAPATNPASSSTPLAYMVMDYVEGQTLAAYLHATSRQGNIPNPAVILQLFTSIGSAIDYAHQNNMIHRDIKPANILLDTRNTTLNPMGEPILTDFGVAKLMSATATALSGTQVGTPLYISPEQARGYPGNERSDLYSLGIILYEIMTGVTPFRGDSPQEVMMQQINATPLSPTLINPAIPPALALVITRSIAKDPEARFPSAASMVAAIAESLNLPVPDGMDIPAYPTQAARHTPTVTPLPPVATTPAQRSRPLSAANAALTPLPPVPTVMQPASTGVISGGGHVTSATQVATSPPSSPARSGNTPMPPVAPRRGNRMRWLLIALILLLVLAGSGIAGFLYLSHARPSAPVAASVLVGRASFVSSGNITAGSSQGIADTLKVDLQIPPPPQGKSYYLWLLGDKQPIIVKDQTGPALIKVPLLLTNNLPVVNHSVHYVYDGKATNHNNLISYGSRLLITEEAANQTPTTYSSDHATWRYYAEIPQEPIPGDSGKFSALIHIRHLFYNETSINVLGLPGGLDFWFFRNTESVLQWSIAARDDWHGANTTATDYTLIHELLIRMLDYMDGSTNIQVDVPPGTPVLADPTISKVAMLTLNPKVQLSQLDKDPPGYVDHVQLHVNQISLATDITPEMRKLTASILDAVKNTKVWLLNAHQDVAQLFAMSPQQLQGSQAGTLLDDAVQQLTYAFIGQPDPVTNQIHSGVLQMHYAIQQLASFTVTSAIPNTI